MPRKPAPTLSEIVEEELVRVVDEYRQLVAQAANGEELNCDNRRAARLALRKLGLPSYCLHRDPPVFRRMAQARHDRDRRELAVLFPHLFHDTLQWIRERRADEHRRRYLLAQIERARCS